MCAICLCLKTILICDLIVAYHVPSTSGLKVMLMLLMAMVSFTYLQMKNGQNGAENALKMCNFKRIEFW